MALNRNDRQFLCPDCAEEFKSSAGRGAQCPRCGTTVEEPLPAPRRRAKVGSTSAEQIRWRTRMKARGL